MGSAVEGSNSSSARPAISAAQASQRALRREPLGPVRHGQGRRGGAQAHHRVEQARRARTWRRCAEKELSAVCGGAEERAHADHGQHRKSDGGNGTRALPGRQGRPELLLLRRTGRRPRRRPDHGVMRGVHREGRDQRDGQGRGEGERQPRRDEAGQDAHQGRAQDEGQLVGGAFVGQRRVEVRGVRVASAAGGQRHPADPGQGADLRAAGTGHEGGGQDRDGGRQVLSAGDQVGGEDQRDDGDGVEDGGEQQHRALAQPVRQRAEDAGRRARSRCPRLRPPPRRRRRSR